MVHRCIVCDSETDHPRVFVKNGRDFLRCDACGLIIVHDPPSRGEMTNYYDADYESESGMGTARTVADSLFRATARARLPRISGYCPAGRWLDVGCANGSFLEVIDRAGYDAHGIDLSGSAIDIARKKGLKVRAATIEDCHDDLAYDIVSAFDVIEHVLDPSTFVEAADHLLKPGGVLTLTTPDTRSVMARVMGPRWYEYIPETHFFNFNRGNLESLLGRFGFELLRVSRAYKYLNFDYAQIQFKAYNPLIYRTLKVFGNLLPKRAREYPLRFYIGEMLIVARKKA